MPTEFQHRRGFQSTIGQAFSASNWLGLLITNVRLSNGAKTCVNRMMRCEAWRLPVLCPDRLCSVLLTRFGTSFFWVHEFVWGYKLGFGNIQIACVKQYPLMSRYRTAMDVPGAVDDCQLHSKPTMETREFIPV